jgi:hypothetical protein
MNHHTGFAAVAALLVIVGAIILGGIGYVALNPSALHAPAPEDGEQVAPGDHPETDHEAHDGAHASIAWRFADAGETDGVPRTSVTVAIDGTVHAVGSFAGSCSELGASGGIDGKGLLAGELSAAQCWFAGGGNEIGVFANEDGGYDVMVGDLSEGESGAGVFRGDFKVRAAL